MVVKKLTTIEDKNSLHMHDLWPESAIFQTTQYRDARVEAHNALFWMARSAHSFLDPTAENRHLSLFWHKDNNDFRTRVLVDGLQIGLYLPDLELYFCENEEKAPHSFWLDDRTPAFIEAWYLVELLHRHIDQEKFSTSLPFESNSMLMGDTQEHSASVFKTELAAINFCIIKAVDLLQKVANCLSEHDNFSIKQGQISLEPEAFTVVLRANLSFCLEKTLLVGFSVGDHLRPAPFFFIKTVNHNIYPKNHILDYDPGNVISLNSLSDNERSDQDLVKSLCHTATVASSHLI